ncbi:MAG: tRNA (N(6)-L-threonylcarbamoyladenosine(37)-C(2))-methylthiotransferase MtaB [Planctomycetes bacterium]|nr:tRNA (N(6)-L-threonylcarbamoyladenosine(37)-C(2))-methylthiotransferase MtaB [Planctomycetota bacterium]
MTDSSRTCRFVTFGCKANLYDTQRLRELLKRRGYGEVGEGPADLVVVNTCTVTAEAGRKARQLVRRLRRENPAVEIAVTGCLAESEPEGLRSIEGVRAVVGNGERESASTFLRAIGEQVNDEELGLPPGIEEFTGRTRAFLKIQDGCDHACAFCIIPSVRGTSRSRTPEDLCAELARLVAAGYREVVLCGIHIGEYGLDRGTTLADLVARMTALPGTFRLRLSSIEATEVTEDLLAAMTRTDKVCHHLHMPMQSGDDRVLEAMNRWYDVATYLRAIERVHDVLDQPALTGDVIVGFPGEDDRAFAETLRTVERAGFSRLHVFPFSPRPGTPAATLGGAVEPQVTRQRRQILADRLTAQGERYRASLVGRSERVVFEQRNVGLTDRYQRFVVHSERDHQSELRPVLIESHDELGLGGSLVDVAQWA